MYIARIWPQDKRRNRTNAIWNGTGPNRIVPLHFVATLVVSLYASHRLALLDIYRVGQKLWPKRSGLLWPHFNTIHPIFTEMSYFCQPFEEFTKITQELIHFFALLSFEGFSSQSSTLILFVLCLEYQVQLILKNGVPNLSDGPEIKQYTYVHNVGLCEQATWLGGGIWSLDMHSTPWEFSLSAHMRCHTSISRNDPISLSNEIQKIGSDRSYNVIGVSKK